MISKFDYLYDASGQITNWTQQTDTNDPQKWTMQYDNEGKLLNVNVADTVTSAVLHQYAYTYDPNGNRTSEQIDGNIVSSSYNNLNQLTGQSAGGSMVFSGTLNKASTVTVGGKPASLDSTQTNFRGSASVTQGTNNVPIVATNLNGYATTNTFQVVIPPASGSYTYDLNGNLTNDGTRTYSWDAKDELVGIVYTTGPNAGNHTEFTYNGARGRVKIVERTGTVLGSGTVTSTKQYVGGEERDGNNLVTKRYFAQGEQRISGSTVTNYFYTYDHLGSVREMVDNNGTTIDARYSYDPYGRRTQVSGSIVCDFGFTGYYTHANSGLDLSATRAYDPNTGRFNQRDPSGEGSGLNLYAYCADDPINFVDLLGLRDVSSRLKQAGNGLLDAAGAVGSMALAVGFVVASGFDGPGAVLTVFAAVIAIFNGSISGAATFANITAAFAPDTEAGNEYAERAEKMPSSLAALIAKGLLGDTGQKIEGSLFDVEMSLIDLFTLLTDPNPDNIAALAADIATLAQDLSDMSQLQVGGGSSPTGTGCMDDVPDAEAINAMFPTPPIDPDSIPKPWQM